MLRNGQFGLFTLWTARGDSPAQSLNLTLQVEQKSSSVVFVALKALSQPASANFVGLFVVELKFGGREVKLLNDRSLSSNDFKAILQIEFASTAK